MEKVLLYVSVIVSIVLLGTLILTNTENNYHYAYIDSMGNLGLAIQCRHNKCEDINGQVVSVIDYIDIREK